MLERLRRRTLVLTESRRRQRYNCHQQDDESWERRAETAVGLWRQGGDSSLSPLRIADLGAGSERLRDVLRRGLEQSFEYAPYDLHPQRPTTQRLDLEREVPDRQFDLIFCLGVLEYLPDLPGLLPAFGGFCRFAVVSYVPTDCRARLSRSARQAIGWRSHLSRRI